MYAKGTAERMANRLLTGHLQDDADHGPFRRLGPLQEHQQNGRCTDSLRRRRIRRQRRAVSSFLTNRQERPFTGVSSVEIRFLDDLTHFSFRRVRALRGMTTEGTWRLVRRWADAHGDGGLDERMCQTVAVALNLDFAGLLTATVVTWVIRTP